MNYVLQIQIFYRSHCLLTVILFNAIKLYFSIDFVSVYLIMPTVVI